MAAPSDSIRILLIRAWTEPLAPFRDALRNAGIAARIARVDIEPALNAALSRGAFDVVVIDPNTPGLARGVVEARLREHRTACPIVVFESLQTAVAGIRRVLANRSN
jgi:hypothetical protein